MEKFTLVLTSQEVDTLYRGLLELPTKFALPVMQSLERQVKEQEAAFNTEDKAEVKE